MEIEIIDSYEDEGKLEVKILNSAGKYIFPNGDPEDWFDHDCPGSEDCGDFLALTLYYLEGSGSQKDLVYTDLNYVESTATNAEYAWIHFVNANTGEVKKRRKTSVTVSSGGGLIS